jgi:hypothetical protein
VEVQTGLHSPNSPCNGNNQLTLTIGHVEDYEAETTSQDAPFIMMALLMDLDDLRYVMKWGWQSYLDHRLDLAAVAVMTNTAIDLARQLEEFSRPVFAEMSSKEHIKCMNTVIQPFEVNVAKVQKGMPHADVYTPFYVPLAHLVDNVTDLTRSTDFKHASHLGLLSEFDQTFFELINSCLFIPWQSLSPALMKLVDDDSPRSVPLPQHQPIYPPREPSTCIRSPHELYKLHESLALDNAYRAC